MVLLLLLAVLAVPVAGLWHPERGGPRAALDVTALPLFLSAGAGRTKFPSCGGVGVRGSCGDKSPPPLLQLPPSPTVLPALGH